MMSSNIAIDRSPDADWREGHRTGWSCPRTAIAGIAASLACMLGTLSTVPARAELRAFANWIVGCDNRAECTAIGWPAGPADPGAPSVAIRIGVDRTSFSGFSFAIIRLPSSSNDRRPIIVSCQSCSRATGASGSHGADRIEVIDQRIDVTEMRGARWLDSIGKGHSIGAAWSDGPPSATIDTSAFMDAWKHLAQRRGALMRGAMSADIASSPLARSLTEDAPRAAPSIEVTPSGAPALLPGLGNCPAGTDKASYRQFALPAAASLWGVACEKGGVATQHWFQTEGPAGNPSPLMLPDADRGPLNAGDPGFAESMFDFDFSILRARSGPAGRQDCGVQRAWGWNGRTWVLLERREMPVCIGLEPSDWVRTYATP